MNYKDFVQDKYPNGVIVPWWKGFVYDDFSQHMTVVAPLGFNILFSLVFCIHRLLRRGLVDHVKFYQRQQRCERKINE